jgi:aspartate/methionine/tyrosine aminotransferase
MSYKSIELPSIDLATKIITLDPPFIEDTLDNYSDEESITLLALGSSYWTPPIEAYQHLSNLLLDPDTTTIHKYGNLFGDDLLRDKIKNRLNKHGLNMDNMINIITSGANQGFINICLSLINKDDNSIILAPYYCSHKMVSITMSTQYDLYNYFNKCFVSNIIINFFI